MRTLDQLTETEIASVAAKPLQERCCRIVDEFDEWLARRVVRFKLAWTDLPQLNDAFRDYFASTRTSRGALLGIPSTEPEKTAVESVQPESVAETPESGVIDALESASVVVPSQFPRGVNAFEARADGALIIYAELPDMDGEPVRIEPPRVADLLAACGNALARKPSASSSFRTPPDGTLIIHDTTLTSTPIRVKSHLVGTLLATCGDALTRKPSMRGGG